MAITLDNVGRKIDTANLSLDELKAMMNAKVGPAKKVTPENDKHSASLDKIKSLLEKYTKDFKKVSEEQKKFLKDVLDNLNDIKVQKAKLNKTSDAKQASKADKSLIDLKKEFHKTLGTKGSAYTHDTHCEVILNKILTVLESNAVSGGTTGRRRGGRDRSETNMDYYLDPETKRQVGLEEWLRVRLNNLATLAREIEKSFMGFNAYSAVFDGIVSKEREFTQNIREVAYQTAGITKESQGLQKIYELIGESVQETGFNRTEFQQSYLKALKGGIKDQKTAIGLSKAQLHTEKQLGLQAGTLSDTFMEWNQSGRMNVGQLEEMSRGLRDVAKNTGLTGENLAGVVRSSEQFIKNLRNAGQLTASASKNIIEILANAKKLGVEDEAGKILNSLSSVRKLLYETDSKTQSYVFRIAGKGGVIDKAMTGTLLRSKMSIGKFVGSMEQDLMVFASNFGAKSIEDIENLSDAAKAQLDLVLSNVGPGLGETINQIKAFRDASKDLGTKLSEIRKEQMDGLIDEKTFVEKERQLKFSSNMQVLNSLNEATKGAKDMNQAFEKFGRLKPELEKDLNALGTDWKDNAQVARDSINKALAGINEGRKKAGMTQVTIDSSEIEKAMGDKSSYERIIGKLDKASKELATEQEAQLDPLKSMQKDLHQINETLREYTQGIFSTLFNTLIGKVIVLVGAIAGISSLLGIRLWNIWTDTSSIRKLISRHFKAPTLSGMGSGTAMSGKTDTMAKKVETMSGKLGDSITEGMTEFFKAPVKKTKDLLVSTWTGTFDVMQDVIIAAGSKTKQVAVAAFSGITGVLSAGKKNIAGAASAISFASIGAGFGKIYQGALKLPGLLTKGVAGGMGAVVKGGGKMSAVLLRLAGAIPVAGWAITGALAAVDGFTRAMNAGEKAGEIFNKKQEDISINEEYSAKAAGLLIGALDGLSFGVLGMVFNLDKAVEWLAKFNAKIPILTVILGTVIVAFEAIWGVIKGIGLGIWEILKGLWAGIMEIIQPIIDGLTNIFSTLSSMFGATGDKASNLSKIFHELGGVVGIISGPIKWIGKMIGWIFRIIGKAVGFIVKGVMALVEGFMVAFEPFAEVFSALGDVFGEIFDIFSDIFTGIWDFIKPVMSLFGDFEGSGKGFIDVLKQVGKFLGQVVGTIVRFILQPLMIAIKVISGIAKIIRAIFKVFTGDFAGAKDLVKQAIEGVWDAISSPFKKLFESIGLDNIWKNVVEQLSNLGTWLWDTITGALSGLTDWIKRQIPGRETLKKVGNFFDRINPFEEGTNRVQNSGLAYLHKDEMVVPSKNVNDFIAQGTGSFNQAGNFLNKINPWANPVANAINPMATDIQQQVMNEKASKGTQKIEIVSEGIDELTSEVSGQTELQEQLVLKMDELINIFKSKGASGSFANNTSNTVNSKPANYYKRTVGLKAQGASKAILNIGPQNI